MSDGLLGIFDLNGTLEGTIEPEASTGLPVNADALPTFRIYDGEIFIMNATAAFLHTGTVTGATNASPIVITSANHNLYDGMRVTISGVLGNTAANGTFVVTRIDANTFSLNGSTGNGSYTSGGTWNVTGSYRITASLTESNGFAAGKVYTVRGNATISGQSGYESTNTFQIS